MTPEKKKRILHGEHEYAALFATKAIRERALEVALDVRKFEIDLYWKRAAYFWTIIAAAFVGFGAAQQLSDQSTKTDLSVVVGCLGTLFSFAWFCINKGSKYWQTNWEKHVDMLEGEFAGPLYRINWLEDSSPSNTKLSLARFKSALVEGSRFSVTRINQLVSLFVFIVWFFLLLHVLPINLHAPISPLYATLVSLTMIFGVLIFIYGKSGRGRPLTTFKIRGERADSPKIPRLDTRISINSGRSIPSRRLRKVRNRN